MGMAWNGCLFSIQINVFGIEVTTDRISTTNFIIRGTESFMHRGIFYGGALSVGKRTTGRAQLFWSIEDVACPLTPLTTPLHYANLHYLN